MSGEKMKEVLKFEEGAKCLVIGRARLGGRDHNRIRKGSATSNAVVKIDGRWRCVRDARRERNGCWCLKMQKTNPMQQIFLDKLVINIGIGSTEDKLESAKALLKKLTGKEPAHHREEEVPGVRDKEGPDHRRDGHDQGRRARPSSRALSRPTTTCCSTTQ